MDSDLSRVKVGSYICTTANGWERVKSIGGCRTLLIGTDGQTYLANGKSQYSDMYPSAFIVPPEEWIAPPAPIEKRKIKDAVSLLSTLINTGYRVKENGVWIHESTDDFTPRMWYFCGSVITGNEAGNWIFRDEWFVGN